MAMREITRWHIYSYSEYTSTAAIFIYTVLLYAYAQKSYLIRLLRFYFLCYHNSQWMILWSLLSKCQG